MNLTITQSTGLQEIISAFIVDKLYEIAYNASTDPDSTVILSGNLLVPSSENADLTKITWLNSNFSPNLIITVSS